MYYYENKEYSHADMVTLLFRKCLENKNPMARTASKGFDILDTTGEWYNFYFKFNENYELVLFSCKKSVDITTTSLRDCWKYILEGINTSGKEVKGFQKNTEVFEYLKQNKDKPYRLERKERNGEITVKGVIYDSILDTLVVNRVPWKKMIDY